MKAYALRKNDKDASAKPLVLVVITDGAQNDENKLRNTLITAVNDATTADEVSVVFVEVGEDNQAASYLEDLERNLNQEGAKFKIAHALLFDTVARRGLLQAVADVVAPPLPADFRSKPDLRRYRCRCRCRCRCRYMDSW